MKKMILLFVAIGFIALGATTMSSSANATANKNVTNAVAQQKYKACIDACNACVSSCKKVEAMCSKEKDGKMADCMRLCKECVVACVASSQLMTLDSGSSKEMCVICANICDKCATECEKFTADDCKKCAMDCRKAAKMCREM